MTVRIPLTTAPELFACIFTFPSVCLMLVASIPVKFAPLPKNDVAVTELPIDTFVAVTIPVTSIPVELDVTAYPTFTSPVTVNPSATSTTGLSADKILLTLIVLM